MASVVERLKRTVLFKGIDEPSLEVFEASLEEQRFADGDPIFREGEPGDSLYVLDEGSVVVSKIIDWDDMREKTLAILPAGAFFGEGALMEDLPRSATVRARGKAVVFRLTRNMVMRLVKTSPLAVAKLLFAMIKVVNARLRQTSHELVTLYDTGRIAGSSLSFDLLLDRIAERASESLQAASCLIFLQNPYTRTLDLGIARGAPAPVPPFDPSQGIFAEVMGRGRPVMTASFSGTGLERLGFEPESLLAVPLTLEEQSTGMILVGDREGGQPFHGSHLHLLQGIASQVATAIDAGYRRAEEQAAAAHQQHWVRF